MHKCLKLTYIYKSHIHYCIMWLDDYLDGQLKMLNMNNTPLSGVLSCTQLTICLK